MLRGRRKKKKSERKTRRELLLFSFPVDYTVLVLLLYVTLSNKILDLLQEQELETKDTEKRERGIAKSDRVLVFPFSWVKSDYETHESLQKRRI